MKKSLLYTIFFLLPFFSYTEEFETIGLQAGGRHTQVYDQRENYFQTATSYKITPNVNPVTGNLIEEETDLVVAGSEPLSIRRFYNHTATDELRTGGWRYNPEAFLVANFEFDGQEMFAAAGEANGNIASFKSSAIPYTYTFNFTQGFSHFTPDGKTHPLNTKINYYKVNAKKEKHYFWWRGEVIDGSRTVRVFDSGKHCWLSNLWSEVYRKGRDIYASVYTPQVWTPYQLPVYEERKPNGNIICYSYTRWKDGKYYPTPPLLSSITAYNHDKTKNLGSITFQYSQDKHGDVYGITVIGSDGRKAAIQHDCSRLLKNVVSSDKPPIEYGYHNRWLNRIEKPEGRVVTTDYDSSGKVAAQNAPVGPNEEMQPIARYIYHDKATEVYDAENNKTVYRFNEHKQILSLEVYKDDALYRVDRLTWDSATGNLLKKTIEDGFGKILQITEYTYDKNHNSIIERVGNGKQWRTIHRTFSEDGFNLKLSETEREGKLIRYSYLPNTNLLASEFTYEGAIIRKRIFHFYDDCAICIKTIIDDGASEDPNNLQKVAYRKITEITPKKTTPCFGLPEVIEEKTLDRAGNEILLKKIVYTYTPFGQVLKEDHYDARGNYRYSLHNAYDSKERLISHTNQLGGETTFAYDANNNTISISGPKLGQKQEITYDKANRPIRIVEWQIDGTCLVTEKKYDRLGRVVEEIDPCKHKTQYRYDALSRLTTTIHPDGAIEHKEYDPLDHLIKEIDSEGYETRKTYNCYGQVTEIIYPDGAKESFSYYPFGALASHIDKNGACSLYVYDLFDHLVKTDIYSPSKQLLKTKAALWTPFLKISEINGDLVTNFIYDFAGRKVEEQRGYRQIHFFYDTLGRLQKTKEGDTELIEEYDFIDRLIEKRKEKEGTLQFREAYTYDENDNQTQVITSQGITETLFDHNGKPLSIKDPLGFTTQLKYSYDGNFTKVTINPKGIQTHSIYDCRGRETQCFVQDKNHCIIQKSENSYNKNGNKTAVMHTIFLEGKPLKKITHQWEYGPLGRIERFLESGIRETRYLYDEKGRLKTIVKPNNCLLLHEYDDLGRLTRFFSQDFDYHYTYDQNDRVTSICDKISKTWTKRSYDPLGNICEEKLANDLVFRTLYDNLGRKIQLTLPDSTSIEHAYEGHYLHAVKRNDYAHLYSERNLEGELTKATLPDKQELLIERDKLGRYANCISPHYTAFYPKNGYDENGNLLCYHYRDSLGQTECTFSYDDLNQLISEKDHAYQFDSLYNRRKKDHLDYRIDDLFQVSCDGRTTYEYDVCGNLISNRLCKYFYDSLDRLIAIDDGDTYIKYTYDSFNRRLSKTIFGWFSDTYIRYMWDGDNEIGSVDAKNRIQELRVLGEGLGAEIGAAVLFELNGKSYIPIHDHRGCIVTLVDLYTKKLSESYRYTAFGEELTKNKLSPWRFASKRVDEETGFVYFGRRYYHPSLGRWITQDPEGFDDGPNLYAYLKNCPLADFDPYGLWGWNEMWGGTRDFFGGAGSYFMGRGMRLGSLRLWGRGIGIFRPSICLLSRCFFSAKQVEPVTRDFEQFWQSSME